MKPSLKTNIISPRKIRRPATVVFFVIEYFYFSSLISLSPSFSSRYSFPHTSPIYFLSCEMLMMAPGNSRSIFLMTGPDKGEKFRVGSSRISTLALQGSFSEAILLPSGRRTVRGWGDPSRLPCTSAIRNTSESSSSHSSPRWNPENRPASWKDPADPHNSAAYNLRGDPPVLSALPQSFSAVSFYLPRSGRQCIFFPVLLSLR